jgi:hypothetical protein
MKPAVKEWLKMWLMYDLLMAVVLWFTIGPEGLAAMACEVIDDPVCEELE